METKSNSRRKLSFVCSRKELLKVLSTVKMRSNAKLTIDTRLAEHKIILKTNYYEIPIPCIECSGSDASFSLILKAMKAFCELSTNEVIHFSLDGEMLQIDTTIINVK